MTVPQSTVSLLNSCLLAVVLVCVGVLIVPVAAHAQIYVDVNVTGGADDGSSWADAYTDLQDALDVATGNDQIWIAEGTYTPSSRFDTSDPRTAIFLVTGDQDGLKIYGGFENGDAFEDRNPADHPTILSGDLLGNDGSDDNGDGIPDSGRDDNSYHVLIFDGGDEIAANVTANVTTETVLEGVTVTSGNANGRFPDTRGGGLYCDGDGSGNECSPTLESVTFSGNSAGGSSGRGGAIFNDGSTSASQPAKSNPHIINCTFTGNSASQTGGAIYNDGTSGTSSPLISSSTFTGNSASEGGAIFSVGLSGDGISSPQIINSTFSGNSASEGGALFINPRNGGTSSPIISGSVFTGNSASEAGGAIYNDDGGTSETQISGTTFSSNSADFGGAIYNNGFSSVRTGSLEITNSIFWGNSSSTGPQVRNRGRAAILTFSHTLVEDGTNGVANRDGNIDYLDAGGNAVTFNASTNINADPLFADGSDPDGPDDVPATADDGLRLGAGSPALDAGENAALPADIADLDGDGDTTEPIPFDITGSDRVRDNNPDTPPTVDIGAYEAPADVLLPVELVGLSATATGTQGVMLTWQTASETNNAGFHVEQHNPDKDTSEAAAWREIAFVAGAGTTTEKQTYRHRMEDVDYGRHTFRLRQVDLDGTATLSPTVNIMVGLAETHSMAAYPNPAAVGQSATIDVMAREAQAMTVVIYDIMGREVVVLFDGEVAASKTKRLRLSGRTLASGMYFVRAIGERFVATERITIVR